MHKPPTVLSSPLLFPYNRLLWTTIVATVLLCVSSFAQKVAFEPVYYTITTEHGLPSMETYAVKQDSKGYIWICTDAGVCRYDGYEFRTFTTKDGLMDNVVFDIFEDANGRIWFTGIDTRLCYYENGGIKLYKYNALVKPFLKQQLSPRKFLTVSPDGTVYYSIIGCGLIVISSDGKMERRHTNPKQAFISYNGENPIFSFYRMESNTEGIDNSRVQEIDLPFNRKINVTHFSQWGNKYFAELSNGDQFVLNAESIIHLTTGEIVFKEDQLLFMTVKDDTFWIGTLRGVIQAKYDKVLNRLIVVERYFSQFPISHVLFDTNGDAWFSTLKNGVLFCGSLDVFKTSQQNGLIHDDVVDIERFNGQLLVSSLTGIQSIGDNPLKKLNLVANYTNAKLATNGAYLFISSSSASVDKRIRRLTENIIVSNWLSDLQSYEADFYGSSSEVIRFDLHNDSVIQLKPTNHERIENYWGITTCFTIDPSNGIYIGTNAGVFSNLSGKWKEVDLGGGEAYKIKTLNYNSSIGLIVGTMNNGLIIQKGGRIKIIDESRGLLGSKINAVAILLNRWLLIGSSKGMNIYDSHLDAVYNFAQNDCMNAIDVNTFFIDQNEVYIGTEQGLFRVNKDALIDKMERRATYTVLLKGIYFDKRSIDHREKLFFPPGSNLLQVDFSVLQFDNWFSKKYQYRIGKEGHWVDIESPSINLHRPSGEFDIEIRYMDADFRWSDPIKLCHIKVLVPFWMRWYFWTIIVALLTIGIFILYRRRQERINVRLVQENQMLLLEQQMQHARMNPHFIFNVLNSIHSFVIHEDKDQAELYLMKFSRLMRETLAQSREGNSKISDECSILNKYLELERLRSKDRFEFELTIPKSLKEVSIPAMLVQPFVENAVWHGLKMLDAGKLRITFSAVDDRCVKVCIWDNGRMTAEQFESLQRSADKNAFGITKLRLEKYNRLLDTTVYGVDVKYGDGGTEICLRVPIIQEDNK